jgi:UDP-N-acetylglucosamine 2-epimerase
MDLVLREEKPDVVLVIGDTNTTAAAAIATKKRNIVLGHIEAGLREFDRSIPEEINKLITDSISDLYFCPTKTSISNLKHQGIVDHVYLTGEIGLDLLHGYTSYEQRDILLKRFNIVGEFVFMTCHRETNTTNREKLEAILDGASQLERQVIFAVHPRTTAAIEKFSLGDYLEGNIRMIAPLGFWDTQNMIRQAAMVITDSGGVIKEAYFHRVPSIIIDKQTEWIETIEEGWSVIAGADREAITEAGQRISRPSTSQQSLGDGQAGSRIVHILQEYFTC